ncbi:MAG: hypothetical protein ABEJ88_00480 [Halobacterium sp.]
MSPERQYAVTVAVGVAALALCLWLESSGSVAASAGVVYAAASYYACEHPDLLSGREGGSLEAGVLAGVSTFGMMGVLLAEPGGGVVVLAFGLTYFGYANGVAYARDRDAVAE